MKQIFNLLLGFKMFVFYLKKLMQNNQESELQFSGNCIKLF